MTKNTLNNLFENLKEDFDIKEPKLGHQQRFLDKLNNKKETIIDVPKPVRKLWRPLLGVAASIVLLISIFVGIQQNSNSKELVSISPEMANT